MGERWSAADVPDQAGRVAVVTGANSGIGFEVARALAERGATVILACRDEEKAKDAARQIMTGAAGAKVDIVRLDLGSLDSVMAAADQVGHGYDRLDLLINNAGVMVPPYGTTADGFELQFGVNHLGHFAFTGLLAALLLSTPGSRVVTVASLAHRQGRINFGDLHWAQGYRRMAAYGQSKLANLLFTYEFERRLSAAGAFTAALAAHPGFARTSLNRHLPGWINAASMLAPSQDAAGGALPLLRAATDPQARGGEYYGPSGWFELSGHPRRVTSSPRSRDAPAQRQLWQESQRLTGVTYPV